MAGLLAASALRAFRYQGDTTPTQPSASDIPVGLNPAVPWPAIYIIPKVAEGGSNEEVKKPRRKRKEITERWNIPEPEEMGMGRHLLNQIVMLGGRAFSSLATRYLNTTTVWGHDKFLHQFYNRPEGQGLLTIANHQSTIDDPAAISHLIPFSSFLGWRNLAEVRWSLAAEDFCYHNHLFELFFTAAQGLPISRTAGIEQPQIKRAIGKLNKGKWLNIFPEGKVYEDGLGPFKHGVGRIIEEAEHLPVVLPIVHEGLYKVKVDGSLLPGIGQQVYIKVGDPIDVEPVVTSCKTDSLAKRDCWARIAKHLEGKMKELETELHQDIAKLQRSRQRKR